VLQLEDSLQKAQAERNQSIDQYNQIIQSLQLEHQQVGGLAMGGRVIGGNWAGLSSAPVLIYCVYSVTDSVFSFFLLRFFGDLFFSINKFSLT